jgi:hypothetical protein
MKYLRVWRNTAFLTYIFLWCTGVLFWANFTQGWPHQLGVICYILAEAAAVAAVILLGQSKQLTFWPIAFLVLLWPISAVALPWITKKSRPVKDHIIFSDTARLQIMAGTALLFILGSQLSGHASVAAKTLGWVVLCLGYFGLFWYLIAAQRRSLRLGITYWVTFVVGSLLVAALGVALVQGK